MERPWKPGSKLFGAQQIDLGQTETLVDVSSASGEPQVISAALGFVGVPFNANPIAADGDIFAHLLIGIGGQIFTADVDFINGFQFSLVASYLRIDGVYNAMLGSASPGVSPGKVTMAASIAQGSLAAVPPQRTLGTDTTLLHAAGASVRLTVPQFAKSLIVTSRPTPPALLMVIVRDARVLPILTFNVMNNVSPEIQLPNGASVVDILNVSPTIDATQVRAIFKLAL
jgi:hypothetical protein